MAARFRALDGWRGVCALLVAAHHLEARGVLYWQPLIRNAWLFVDFFFVLSGFVIAHAYGDALSAPRQARDFAWRRFARLWPLHIAILLALVTLEAAHLAIAHLHPIAGERAAFIADRSPLTILTNLFLVQSLGLHPYETWNGPAWSISTEFYTYLVFAAICLALPNRWARRALSFVLAVGAALVLAKCSRWGMRETFDWGFVRCLYGFFTGVLTYEIWRSGLTRALRGSVVEVVAVAAVIAFVVFAPGHYAIEFLATPLFSFAVLIFAGEEGVLSRLLTARPADALGRWSYSIYMVHTLILVVLFSAVHSAELAFHRVWLVHLPDGNAILELGSANDLVMIAYLAAVVGLAAFTFRAIERPGQRAFGPPRRAQDLETAPQLH